MIFLGGGYSLPLPLLAEGRSIICNLFIQHLKALIVRWIIGLYNATGLGFKLNQTTSSEMCRIFFDGFNLYWLFYFTYLLEMIQYNVYLLQGLLLQTSSSFSVRSMLTWVGRCLLDDISSFKTVLSECFFQVQNLQIILHNLVPNLVWSSPSKILLTTEYFSWIFALIVFHWFQQLVQKYFMCNSAFQSSYI